MNITQTPKTRIYTASDECGNTWQVEAESLDAAADATMETVSEQLLADMPRTGATAFARGSVWLDGTDERCDYTIKVDPPEPSCDEADEHNWEQGAVQGSGGGVRYTSTCSLCGLELTVDTWASSPLDGSQGHRTESYSRGEAGQ